VFKSGGGERPFMRALRQRLARAAMLPDATWMPLSELQKHR
jgi:hypothetical protein